MAAFNGHWLVADEAGPAIGREAGPVIRADAPMANGPNGGVKKNKKNSVKPSKSHFETRVNLQ